MSIRGKPLPLSVRESIRRQLREGRSLRKTARILGVSVNTVRKYTRGIRAQV